MNSSNALVCTCAACCDEFELVSEDKVRAARKEGLLCAEVSIRSCDSGGIYAIYVRCPHCKYDHDLM